MIDSSFLTSFAVLPSRLTRLPPLSIVAQNYFLTMHILILYLTRWMRANIITEEQCKKSQAYKIRSGAKLNSDCALSQKRTFYETQGYQNPPLNETKNPHTGFSSSSDDPQYFFNFPLTGEDVELGACGE
jgi:hypothetical protein